MKCYFKDSMDYSCMVFGLPYLKRTQKQTTLTSQHRILTGIATSPVKLALVRNFYKNIPLFISNTQAHITWQLKLWITYKTLTDKALEPFKVWKWWHLSNFGGFFINFIFLPLLKSQQCYCGRNTTMAWVSLKNTKEKNNNSIYKNSLAI